MVINCSINGVNHNLHVLVSKNSKRQGLKGYPDIQKGEGVLFYYSSPKSHAYDFSEIQYPCKIMFIDDRMNVIHSETTRPYQLELVRCPKQFNYVIEIPVWYN